ncbi:hypothetical protein IWQ60_011498 [Tieghemiomyces parasiticus]|uniref:Calcipressin n=1 Tax=Tieghemiomyces parasiticus TaxID=78921 RepID=A0A9W8DLL3_9FUNG|nr:hypothetical protein IWQ60_011498 [Tieghemiomyces parasiticus]
MTSQGPGYASSADPTEGDLSTDLQYRLQMTDATSPTVPLNPPVSTDRRRNSTSTAVAFPTPALVVTLQPFTTDLAATLEASLAAQFGPLLYFTALSSFSRCIVIFESREKATAARQLVMHGHWHLSGSDVEARAYYYQIGSNELQLSKRDFLKLPTSEKMWLISPPGSPPVGWQQEREDPPNAIPLHEELHQALVDLGGGRFHLDYHSDEEISEGLDEEDLYPGSTTEVTSKGPRLVVTEADVAPSNTSHNSLAVPSGRTAWRRPAIVIESWDTPQSEPPSLPIPRTTLPPTSRG